MAKNRKIKRSKKSRAPRWCFCEKQQKFGFVTCHAPSERRKYIHKAYFSCNFCNGVVQVG